MTIDYQKTCQSLCEVASLAVGSAKCEFLLKGKGLPETEIVKKALEEIVKVPNNTAEGNMARAAYIGAYVDTYMYLKSRA